MTDDPAGSISDATLDVVSGALRESVGAIRNLEQLLRSINVGPKALRAVVPDVHDACAPMISAMEKLLAEAAPGSDTTCIQALAETVVPRVEELESALGAVGRRTIRARQRLTLERVVTRVSRKLSLALDLVDLMQDAKSGRAVTVDVVELVRETASLHDTVTPGTRTVRLSLDASAAECTVRVNPHVATALLSIAAGLVTSSNGPDAHVRVRSCEGQGCDLTVAPGPVGADTIDVAAREVMPASRACAASLARAIGARMETAPDGVVAIRLPPA